MSESTESPSEWAARIPISINDTYGDPFIVEQVKNTLAKVNEIRDHKAPIAIFTKAPYNKEVVSVLRDMAENPMVVPFYSLTGLDEGGYSFENRRRMIDAIHDAFGYVVMLTRPIIRNRNDDPKTLRKIVRVAEETSRLLVLGGVHDSKKRKKLEVDVEQMLLDMCDENGVRAFHKSSCLAAFVHDQECWVHDYHDVPRNLNLLPELGYSAYLKQDGDRSILVLPSASTGDLNFLRILTRSQVYTEELISNYNLLTIPSGTQKYECTSSWYCWAKNIDTCLDCNYCIILQIEYLKKNPVQIGTYPGEMPAIIRANNSRADFSEFKLTKLPNDGRPLHTYEDARVTKPCLRHRYEKPSSVLAGR